MKTKTIFAITCIFALITVSAVSACTGPNCSGNSDNGLYSSKGEAISALDSARSSGSSNSDVFEELKKSNPDKKADLWDSAVSVYYADPSSGYKSVYQDGDKICKDGGELKDKYVPNGEDVNQTDEKPSYESEENNSSNDEVEESNNDVSESENSKWGENIFGVKKTDDSEKKSMEDRKAAFIDQLRNKDSIKLEGEDSISELLDEMFPNEESAYDFGDDE